MWPFGRISERKLYIVKMECMSVQECVNIKVTTCEEYNKEEKKVQEK